MSPSWLPTVSTLSYLTLTLITTAFVCLSCAFLLVQAVRTSPSRSIENNWNVVIIGAAYVLVVSLLIRQSSPVLADMAVKLNAALCDHGILCEKTSGDPAQVAKDIQGLQTFGQGGCARRTLPLPRSARAASLTKSLLHSYVVRTTAGLPVYYPRVREILLDHVRICSKGWRPRGMGFAWYERNPHGTKD